MEKTVLGTLFIAVTTILISWGYIERQTVGIIAENHIAPLAKKAVGTLPGDKSLGAIASSKNKKKSIVS